MRSLVLVDTSVFISYLRGDADDALAVLTLNNQVLLSPIVRLELLAGVSKSQIKAIERLCNAVQNIESFAPLAECEKLLMKVRGSGLFGGLPDFLILVDAYRYDAPVFTYDKKMKKLADKLHVKLLDL